MSAVADPDVQTSAPARGHAEATLAFTGQLVRKPHVAVAPCDTLGHHRPVVVLEICHVGPANQRMQAVVPCDTHEAADAMAHSLKRGDTVDVACALSEIRLYLGAATLSVHQE